MKMEKWSLMMVLFLLKNVCPSCAYPRIVDVEMQGLKENDDHSVEDCSHWSYPSTNWPSKCPQYCAGSSQSPIDIVTARLNTVLQLSWGNLNINYISGPASVNMKNNGHSATISWDGGVNEISCGGLDGTYTLAQFHFHWGCENSRGSEHTVDGQSYPLELHLVHYKTAYGSLGDAIKHTDGLAVLGIFFNIGTENAAIKPITDNLSQITASGTDADIPYNKAIVDLLPMNSPPEFYRYKGSLTTPTCNEVVIWTIYKHTAEISQDQLVAFRSLQDHDGNPLCDNYREVQPLNGRTITANSHCHTEGHQYNILLNNHL